MGCMYASEGCEDDSRLASLQVYVTVTPDRAKYGIGRLDWGAIQGREGSREGYGRGIP